MARELVAGGGEAVGCGGYFAAELADLAPEPDRQRGEHAEPEHTEPDEQQHPEQHAHSLSGGVVSG